MKLPDQGPFFNRFSRESCGIPRGGVSSSQSSSPLVSVIVPFYKQEQFLGQAIDSIKTQSHQNVEIIVVDDGSPISAESVLSYQRGVSVYRTLNRERSAARNFGFAKSGGEYVLFLDADDRLPPHAIQSHLAALERNLAAGFSFGSVRTIDSVGNCVRPPHTCRRRDNYFLKLLEVNPIASPGAVMFRRHVIEEAGLFPEAFRQAEDYLLYLRVAKKHDVVHHTECVLEYRIHAANTCNDKDGMLTSTLAALEVFESESVLTKSEKWHLDHGRKRWKHIMRPNRTVVYYLHDLYFKFHAFSTVSWRSYLVRSEQ
jgi:glycosyltransferase involved in cell wall biosynthesis